MRNLIIGCASNYDWSTLQYWCNSINQSGFDGDKVLVLMNCDKTTVLKVQEEGFKIIAFKKDDEGKLPTICLLCDCSKDIHYTALKRQKSCGCKPKWIEILDMSEEYVRYRCTKCNKKISDELPILTFCCE